MTGTMLSALTDLARRHLPDSSDDGAAFATPVPGLLLLSHEHPTPLDATLYEPVVCLILQGEKETAVGEHRVRFGAGESLVVSHDLPVVSRITRARPQAPYIALIFEIELSLLRSLYEQVGDAALDDEPATAMEAHATDPRLTDSLARYLQLADDEVEARVMGPLLRQEIHFRLLMAPHGAMLRRLLRLDSHASRIARAIGRIRSEFKSPLVVPELARDVGMSTSSFHKHFKEVTSTTPLQYQKDLRLLEARRLLSTEGLPVSSVAWEVGYESPSQFSREYARKFGVPPREDLSAAVGE